MNLIEQLGGYEKAKEKRYDISHTLDNSEILGGGDAREGLYERLESIDKALLEYRRQHNIYEVGDKVISKENNELVSTVMLISDGMARLKSELFDHVYLLRDFRHATDAEIKAGKRLEVS